MFGFAVPLIGTLIASKTGTVLINVLKDEYSTYRLSRKDQVLEARPQGDGSVELETTVSELDRKLVALSESEDRQTDLIQRLVELEDQHSSELVSLSKRVIVFQWISIGSLGVGITALVLSLFVL
jgi:hypothetical protein